MTLSVSVRDLARALGASVIGHPPDTIALPVHCPEWLGPGPSHPVRRGPPLADEPRPALRLLDTPDAARGDDGVPVLHTTAPDARLRVRLRRHLDRHLPLLVPGTLVAVAGTGVLLQGPAGCGKSETALGLLDRGHRLVADDAVVLRRAAGGRLRAGAADGGGRFLVVRGLGPLDVHRHYGDQDGDAGAIDLIVTIGSPTDADPLAGGWHTAGLMGRAVPALALRGGRNLPLLVEAAVRERALAGNGHDGVRAIVDWQQARLACD